MYTSYSSVRPKANEGSSYEEEQEEESAESAEGHEETGAQSRDASHFGRGKARGCRWWRHEVPHRMQYLLKPFSSECSPDLILPGSRSFLLRGAPGTSRPIAASGCWRDHPL